MVKPLLKWCGGKTHIIDTIISNFPRVMDNYHEIFLGGGSVLLAFLELVKNKEIVVSKIFAYDLNEDLINLYNIIKDSPQKLYDTIMKIINDFNKCDEESKESYYYWIRDVYNNEEDVLAKSAMFIFLNKTCFRGLYRVGPNGYNVPYGRNKNPEIINKKHLFEVHKLIQNVTFKVLDFKESLLRVEDDDFVYLDPPYYPLNKSSFTSYNKNGFDEHEKLFEMCKKINYFLLSNSSVEEVKKTFKEKKYSVEEIECKRRINSKKPNSVVNEVLIRSF